MDSGFIPSLIAFGLALVFVITGVVSLFTGKNYMKVRNSPLDRRDSRFRFYTCIAFQFVFGAVLLFASCQWSRLHVASHDQGQQRIQDTEQEVACDRMSEKATGDLSAVRTNASPIHALRDRVASIKPGTPRSEVLRLAGLTEEAGARRISYWPDKVCGSMETWITSTGDKIQVQGFYFDKEGLRREPYIIAIVKRSEESETRDEVIWSGPNLKTGTDIFAPKSGPDGQPAAPSHRDKPSN